MYSIAGEGYPMYIMDIDLKLKNWAFKQRKNLPFDLKLQLTEKLFPEGGGLNDYT